MAQIRAANAGRPHIIALWSLTCPPCHDELALLGAFRRDHPDMRLVLISTDSPADAPALEATLQRHGLGQLDSWVFADDYLERLRHEIDPAWRGELPRTYLYRRTGEAQVHTGTLTREMLTRWLAR
jgi:DNA-binding transcriptional LysR family regulator